MLGYTIGRENISATIFVPYDCDNGCGFCTTKQFYRGDRKVDFDTAFEKMKKHIDLLTVYGVTIFTLTGGEPLADLEKCKKIVDYIYSTAIYKEEVEIYINTSLPKKEGVDDIVNYLNSENSHISGISISRHRNNYELDLKLLANIFDDEEIKLITRPSVRINCLVTRLVEPEKFVQRFKNHNVRINFRANYMKVTHDNIHDKDEFFEKLNSLYEYYDHTECKICNTEIFKGPNNLDIMYHKGIYTTKVEDGNYIEINDFVIDMFGDAYIDWIFEDENLLTREILVSINKWLDTNLLNN